ncbi:PREDICTED: sulfotransferase 1A3-like [Gekko japonicus]|uniref:Sulfotransferase n=1 Tax=Gekko japonicus TaxID=146911 RepID=A0ABM1JL33_GEKJA|nr:PREDICTED: sulfotransferase 1A3-like [Gekko japonicus]
MPFASSTSRQHTQLGGEQPHSSACRRCRPWEEWPFLTRRPLGGDAGPEGVCLRVPPLSSFPGTTWMQEILTLIYSKGDPEPATSIPNWARAPWLEHVHFKEILQETDGPRLLTTHLPWRVLAATLQKGKPKVIYVARNPKDVAVSFYHFHRMANFFPDPGTFDDFLLRFLDGTVHYGSWFQHVQGWLSCQKEMDLFWVTYEELHQDLRDCVERLSAFLGCPLQPGQIEAIQEHSSFASMRANPMVNYTLVPQEILDSSKSTFMRKGIVGDWRNHFSAEQSALFNKVYQREMADCSLSFQEKLRIFGWTMSVEIQVSRQSSAAPVPQNAQPSQG